MPNSRRRQSTLPRPQNLVDLHTHTTASDGELGPQQLVRAARSTGLRTISITDHDSTSSVDEAIAAGIEIGLAVVPGVEINTSDDGQDIHVLGYFLDYNSTGWTQFMHEQQRQRIIRAENIVNSLHQSGMLLDMALVHGMAEGGSVGRPHIARAMVKAGYVRSVGDAFVHWLGVNKPAYVARRHLRPCDAVAAIRSFGGVPVLAHPAGLINLEGCVQRLSDSGLEGLECYYGQYRGPVVSALLALARRYHLIPTGGSDFHGKSINRRRLLGAVFVPPDTPAQLLARRESVREIAPGRSSANESVAVSTPER